ncbi:MAG TPA: hypothetical protein VHM28_11755 [Anaerolineales bacterium]|nr:hypothetical protein [Anaerolineales bacterium]
MAGKKIKLQTSDKDLKNLVDHFLHEHPEVQQMLNYFGISNEEYQRILEAQSGPVYYTATSTNEGGKNGELD